MKVADKMAKLEIAISDYIASVRLHDKTVARPLKNQLIYNIMSTALSLRKKNAAVSYYVKDNLKKIKEAEDKTTAILASSSRNTGLDIFYCGETIDENWDLFITEGEFSYLIPDFRRSLYRVKTALVAKARQGLARKNSVTCSASELTCRHMMTSQFRSERGKTRKREISRDFSRFFDPAFFRSFIDPFCPFRCCVRTRTHEKG